MRIINVTNKDEALKKAYKIIGGVLAVFWGIVALLFSSRCFAVKYEYPLNYKKQALAYAEEYSLEPALVFAVIKVESGFDKNAESAKGAKGLMQITDETGEYIAKKLGTEEYDLFDVETNLRFGCFYLRYLLSGFLCERTAVAAYNAGEGNVRKWLESYDYSDDGITLKNVPFKETETYLKKIYESIEKYKKIYGKLLDKNKKNK